MSLIRKPEMLEVWQDSFFRRMWRLINAFGKVQQGILQKKMLEKYVQSRNIYENKGNTDKMPGKNSDIYAFRSDIFA